MEILRWLDKDNSQQISLEEFRIFMEDENLRAYFDVHGIDVKDIDMFFKMMASSESIDSNEIDVELFAGGCMRLKGPATSVDLHTLSFECRLMNRCHEQFHRLCRKQFKRIGNQLEKLTQNMSKLGKRVRSCEHRVSQIEQRLQSELPLL